MAKKKKPKEYEIRSFEDFTNIINEKNCDMICGNFYAMIKQFVEMKKKVPEIQLMGFNWIDDGKIEILPPQFTIVVEGDENDFKKEEFVLKFCEKCFQMTNHIGDECQKCKKK